MSITYLEITNWKVDSQDDFTGSPYEEGEVKGMLLNQLLVQMRRIACDNCQLSHTSECSGLDLFGPKMNRIGARVRGFSAQFPCNTLEKEGFKVIKSNTRFR